MTKEEKKALKRVVKITLATKSFISMCEALVPNMYNSDNPHLYNYANDLSTWYDTGLKKFIATSAPPQTGKSLTLKLFCLWLIAKNPKIRIMVLCYSKKLATGFSRAIRGWIEAEHVSINEDSILFCDIFPGIKIKQGEGAAEAWGVEGSPFSTLYATSLDSAKTGYGCDLLIIDDVVADETEARNEDLLRERFAYINDTIIMSRVVNGGRVICESTRWSKFDITGQLCELYADNLDKHVYKALQDDGTMLAPKLIPMERYQHLKSHSSDLAIFLANYQQELIDVKGRLYQEFKTWTPDELPEFDPHGRKYVYKTECMTDVADRGTDYLCSIFYYPLKNGKIYVKDIIYTQDPLKITQPLIVDKLFENDSMISIIEGNNGGSILSSNLEKDYDKRYGNYCIFKFFLQTKNKESRILNQALWVQENIYFPNGWEQKWPEFYEALVRFQRDFKSNKHDDAADCVTMIADRFNEIKGKGIKIYS